MFGQNFNFKGSSKKFPRSVAPMSRKTKKPILSYAPKNDEKKKNLGTNGLRVLVLSIIAVNRLRCCNTANTINS